MEIAGIAYSPILSVRAKSVRAWRVLIAGHVQEGLNKGRAVNDSQFFALEPSHPVCNLVVHEHDSGHVQQDYLRLIRLMPRAGFLYFSDSGLGYGSVQTESNDLTVVEVFGDS
jgi:hypothetical protein